MVSRPSGCSPVAVLAVVAALVAAGSVLGVTSPSASAEGTAPPTPTAASVAARRLVSDASGPLELTRDPDGRITFVGTAVDGSVVDPAVSGGSTVAAAARAHLDRYGAALGLTGKATTLEQRDAVHTVAGTDSVTYTQQVGGLPVIGGEVVVDLRPDRQVSSIMSTASTAGAPQPARLTEDDARVVARRVAGRHTDVAFRLEDGTRSIFDPAVLHAPLPTGPRSVYRFEATNGADFRRLLLVDDQTGAVLVDADVVEHLDRVVCDARNLRVSAETPCTTLPARTETSGAATGDGASDVNAAFDNAGRTAAFYQQVGGLDLTTLLGISTAGGKKLASTVRFCYTGTSNSCPYQNAFWNGTQMYYGQGFAVADDVVGHEMTHGVVDQYSQLFYWGQSGAMNESFADVMGEIIDHRNGNDDDTAWDLSEDLSIGALRNMRDPASKGDPDRTGSPLYVADLAGDDSGGVHTNSGVGNKTASLVSQGGTFNGQTITGLDAGDPTLTKTATLYLALIQTLPSGAGWDDLGSALVQRCRDLVTAGTSGFTSAACAEVAKAALATELSTTPAKAAQPADASATCPTGTVKRVLLDGEGGDPASLFTRGSAWTRNSAQWGSNATSGQDSWFARDLPTRTATSLTTSTGIAVPTGQATYLWFQQWRLLDYGGTTYYDAGTVEVDDVATTAPAVDAAALPWVNGPSQTIAGGATGAAAQGRKGFGGDSLGWVASRVDLSAYAGTTVKPQWTMNTDTADEFIGWWLDDISVYTCDPVQTPVTPSPTTSIPPAPPATSPAVPAAVVAGRPSVSGTARVGKKLTAVAGAWSPAGVALTYQWLRNGKAVPGATGATYTLGRKDAGKQISVRVSGALAGATPASVVSAATKVKKLAPRKAGKRGRR